MTESLRDQLLGLGFKAPAKPEQKPERKPERKPDRKPPPRNPAAARQGAKRPHARPPREDIDLAKAYAIRAQKEKDERIEAERQKQEAARLGLAAEIARHFEYGGKIKRVHVNEAQLKALNAGELGVVQVNGRYVLLDAALLAQAEAIFPQAVALKVDPDAPPVDDIPDDLVW